MSKPQGVGIGIIPICHAQSTHAGALWPQGFTCANGKYNTLDGPGRLPDWAIREFITIENFVDYDGCPPGVVSYGLSSGGYDLRVGYKFKVFTNAWCEKVSPRNISPKCFLDIDLTPMQRHLWEPPGTGRSARCLRCAVTCTEENRDMLCGPIAKSILIPPNCFALAETIEHLSIPRNVMCIALGKSTYARCGINLNFTPFEPGWRGIVTVEIINATPCPVEIFAGQGIGQCLFDLMAGEPERAYSDKKNAKYQDQTGLTLPTVK